MLRSISIGPLGYAETEEEEPRGWSDRAHVSGRQVKTEQASRSGRGPVRDARLLVRAAAGAAAERQAWNRRRHDLEEAARAADDEARGEPRQARHPGSGRSRGGPGGSRAAGARAQGLCAAAAPGSRQADRAARRPAAEAVD